jgi:hypothetical protein
MEHAEKLESSMVSFLSTLDPAAYPWPVSLETDAGWRIAPGESDLVKDGQCILCMIEGDIGPEEPPCSGNRFVIMRIELRTPVQLPTDDQVALKLPTPLQNHSTAAEVLANAISRADLPDQLTSTSLGLTVFGLDGNREQLREQTKAYWMSGWRIRIYSCPAAFPN